MCLQVGRVRSLITARDAKISTMMTLLFIKNFVRENLNVRYAVSLQDA